MTSSTVARHDDAHLRTEYEEAVTGAAGPLVALEPDTGTGTATYKQELFPDGSLGPYVFR